jgi:hypothetical protein
MQMQIMTRRQSLAPKSVCDVEVRDLFMQKVARISRKPSFAAFPDFTGPRAWRIQPFGAR